LAPAATAPCTASPPPSPGADALIAGASMDSISSV
jgi:hypothetical protein